MRRVLATPLARRVAVAAGGLGAAHSWNQLSRSSQCSLAAPPPKSKTIHELKLSVSAEVDEAAFAEWLPGYLKHLLELPGLNGAKIARPKPAAPAQPPASKPVVVFVLGGAARTLALALARTRALTLRTLTRGSAARP